jgi:transcriptional regulator with XRE-family HTH domain
MFKFEREKKGLKQNELADLIGVSQQTISKYENGTREPDITNLINLSRIFDVSIDYLLGLQNESQINHETFSNDNFQNLVLNELSKYNISEEVFSAEVNISSEKIHEYLHNRRCPSPDELVLIADYLGLSLDYLFSRSNRRNLSRDEELLLNDYKRCSLDSQRYISAKTNVLANEGLSNQDNLPLHKHEYTQANGTEDK